MPGEPGPPFSSPGGMAESRITVRTLLSTALALTLGLLSTPLNAQVGLQLEAGLDGNARAGRWAPLRVTATNSGTPTTGSLQFLVPGAWTLLTLELSAGANKQVSTVLVPQAGYEQVLAPSRQVATAILRDGRREIGRAETQLRLLPAGFRLLAVCGAEGAGLRFLSGQALAQSGWSLTMEEQAQAWQNQVATAHLSPEQMPREWAGLRAADLLLIRDSGSRLGVGAPGAGAAAGGAAVGGDGQSVAAVR
jgi:hypothetical protein